jgi:tetratricopeptide (TPR) repeat protein
MPVTCARHPVHTAWWQCPQCSKTLCTRCIVRKKGVNYQSKLDYFCPICDVQARDLELFRVIAPLWRRFPKFLAYPFSSRSSAALIIALALLATLFTRNGFFPAVMHFVMWSFIVKFAIEVLESTSLGRLQPPPMTEKTWVDGLPMAFKQVALYFALLLLMAYLIRAGGLWIIIPAIAGCAAILPAILMLLTINEKLVQALNPLMIIGLISRMGKSYLQLVCFLLLPLGAAAVLGYAADNHLPGWWQDFGISVAFNYATSVGYHMTGYVILQYHRRLEYPVDIENVIISFDPMGFHTVHRSDNQTRTPAACDLLITINQLIQKGELGKAIRQIEMHAKGAEINDLDLSERYLELLRAGKHHERFLAYAPHHLELLAKAGYNSKALSLYLECIRLDKNFVPQALILFKIAGWLDETGRNREAVYALNCLIKHHPQNTIVPKALYRVAQIFHEGLEDVERAKKVLTGLIKRYPDHEITAFAKNYLSGL